MENNDFIPLSINLKDKNILVIGAGKIAYHKIIVLQKYSPIFKVVARKITDSRFNDLTIPIYIRDFEIQDLEDIFMVISATDDKKFNKKIYEICNKRNILINNITSKNDMNTRFMAIVSDNNYTVGISANGYPKKSKTLKEKINNLMKEEI